MKYNGKKKSMGGPLLPTDHSVKEVKCGYQPSGPYGEATDIQDKDLERGAKYLKKHANKDARY